MECDNVSAKNFAEGFSLEGTGWVEGIAAPVAEAVTMKRRGP